MDGPDVQIHRAGLVPGNSGMFGTYIFREGLVPDSVGLGLKSGICCNMLGSWIH